VTPLQRGLLVAFLLAVAARLGVVIGIGPILSPDSAGLVGAAEAFRTSILATDEITRTRPPLYPLVIAAFGSVQLVAIAQAIFSAAVAPLIGLATSRWYGVRAAIVAAFAAAIMPQFIEWTPYILTDVMALGVLAIAIERMSASLRSGRLRDDGFAGAAAALTILTRSAYTAALLVLALTSLVRKRGIVVHFATFMLGVVLVLSLPVVRNVASVGIAEIYEGRGWETLWQGTMWNEIGRGTGGIDIIYPPEIATMTSEQKTDFFRREVIKAYTQRPFDMFALAMKKALWFVLPFYPEWSIAHKSASLVTILPVYVLAAWGFWAQRRWPFTWSLFFLASSFVGTAMLTVVDWDARYQLPFLLSLLPLAGAGADAWWGWLWSKTYARSPQS
jgi:hypothetical protein